MELKRYTRKVDTLAKARFNRTFMELKRTTRRRYGCTEPVLIGPLWN